MLVFGTSIGALPMIQSVCSQNRRRASFGHDPIFPKNIIVPGSAVIEQAVEAAEALTAVL